MKVYKAKMKGNESPTKVTAKKELFGFQRT